MQQNLQNLYNRAVEMRAPWLRRWDDALRYTMPTSDDDVATLFDATASDAADNLAASIYTLMTPPESMWMTLVPDSELSPDPSVATNILRANLNDSNLNELRHHTWLHAAIM